MNHLKKALQFFHACEGRQGWNRCKEYVAEGAMITEKKDQVTADSTVHSYVNQLMNNNTEHALTAQYKIHSVTYDNDNKNILLFATYSKPQTLAESIENPMDVNIKDHYIYSIKMNDEGKVERMTKNWCAPWTIQKPA